MKAFHYKVQVTVQTGFHKAGHNKSQSPKRVVASRALTVSHSILQLYNCPCFFLGAMSKLGAINLLYFFLTVLLLNTADHFLSIFTALPLV